MAMRLVQLHDASGQRIVATLGDDGCAVRVDIGSTRELALVAIAEGETLEQAVLARRTDESVDLHLAESERRLLAPLDHPDAAHAT